MCESVVLSQIALMLQGAYNPCKKEELDRLVTEAIDVSGIVCEYEENPVFVGNGYMPNSMHRQLWSMMIRKKN